jgi:prophage regulatory protein
MTAPATPARQPVTVADLARFRFELIEEIKTIIDRRTPSILRMEETVRTVGLKKSTIQAKIAAGDFPPPIDLGGGRAVGFVSSDIYKWIEDRIVASRRNGGADRAARAPITAQKAHERKKRVAGTGQQRESQTQAALPTEHQAAP